MAKVTIEDYQLKGYQQLAKTMKALMASPHAKSIAAEALRQNQAMNRAAKAPGGQVAIPGRPTAVPIARAPVGPIVRAPVRTR